MSSSIGKRRRLAKIFQPLDGRVLLCPIDDSLLAGPVNGLENIEQVVTAFKDEPPSAVVLFKGTLLHYEEQLRHIPVFLNCTASLIGRLHTHKTMIHSVEEAVRLGADGIAAHCNLSSEDELNQLNLLGMLSRQADDAGLPLLAIMYPRGSKNGTDNNYEDIRKSDPSRYAGMVAHAVRVGAEVGADIIKTQYTKDPETFRTVVAAAMGVPVVIAGGPKQSVQQALSEAREVIDAGAAGVSYGRNTFGRSKVAAFVRELKEVLKSNRVPQ